MDSQGVVSKLFQGLSMRSLAGMLDFLSLFGGSSRCDAVVLIDREGGLVGRLASVVVWRFHLTAKRKAALPDGKTA